MNHKYCAMPLGLELYSPALINMIGQLSGFMTLKENSKALPDPQKNKGYHHANP